MDDIESLNKINQLQKLIDEAHDIAFFGGAGVSTESGIPDFRSETGLYKLKSKYDKPYEEMLLTIITQNIDGLHQKAGSKNVIELHGSIHRNYCSKCGRLYDLNSFLELAPDEICSKCGGILKPDVVLYEEPLNEMSITKAIIALQKADLLIIAGTSLNVYPANTLIQYFFGDNIVIINKSKLNVNRKVKLILNENIGEVFSKLK